MTKPNSTAQLQLQVMQYLYGEPDAEQLRDFEKQLESNPELKQLLEAEQAFDKAIPANSQPFIDEERLQGNRWLLRQNLQREAAKGFSIPQWFRSITARPLTLAFQATAMALSFALGLSLATPDSGFWNQDSISESTLARQSPLSLVNENDYEIYQMQVNSYDAVTGNIDLSFSLASETRLTGNVADEGVHQLMAVALQNDIDSQSRLDTINALQPVVSGDQVYEALIHVLTNDQNPGVRYQAVQALVALADEDRVRDALRFALREDVNQGVRIEAFNALSNYRDEETLAVFRQRIDADSNEYIRVQSQLILDSLQQASDDDQIL